jgi:hypothetical protein
MHSFELNVRKLHVSDSVCGKEKVAAHLTTAVLSRQRKAATTTAAIATRVLVQAAIAATLAHRCRAVAIAACMYSVVLPVQSGVKRVILEVLEDFVWLLAEIAV